MNNSIKANIDKCEVCNRCVSRCPVEANKVILDKTFHMKVDIIDDRCIQCGECIRVCKHNSRYYEDDTDTFFRDISKYEMAVIVAPAIMHNIKNFKNLVGYLKSLGVVYVFDISLGADITT